MTTLGMRLVNLRKEKGITQEEVARAMNVTPQSVSKWEKDISAPDISILIELAKFYNVTTDYLLGNSCDYKKPELDLTKESSAKVLRIIVNSADGDKVKVNLPVSVIKALISSNALNLNIGKNGSALNNIDFNQIFALIDQGVIGTLVEVESVDGDTVLITVE